MLEQKDLKMIKDIVESVVQNSENKMESKMGALISESEDRMISRIHESEGRMESKMESLIHESENMVLGELDRVQVNLGKRIDKVQESAYGTSTPLAPHS